MTTAISVQHQKRFEEIKKRLSILGNSESNFLQVELLYFEALSISKEYGVDIHTNSLLETLKKLQHTEYEKAKLPAHKKNQQETAIRHFILGLKKAISVH